MSSQSGVGTGPWGPYKTSELLESIRAQREARFVGEFRLTQDSWYAIQDSMRAQLGRFGKF